MTPRAASPLCRLEWSPQFKPKDMASNMLIKGTFHKLHSLMTVAVVTLTVTVVCSDAIPDDAVSPENLDTNPYTGNLDAIADGRILWRNIGCYSCHGRTAEGGVGPNLSDDTWVYKPTDRTLFNTIARGRSGTNMVGWSNELSADQIWKLVAFIRSLYVGDSSKIIW